MVQLALDFLTKWEPVWLLIVLVAELIYSIRIYTMARIEFDYDKEWNERKAARRKEHAKKESKGVVSSQVPSSSGQKDVALEPGQESRPNPSETGQESLEMRRLREQYLSNRLFDQTGSEKKED